jgi:hypothetical protein
MPTRKQRRRDAKNRRHEWEEVYVDEEGREIPVEEVEGELDSKPAPRAARGEKNGKPQRPAKDKSALKDTRGRTIREIEPPSWKRVGRRALLFGPILFFALIVFAGENTSTVSQILLAAFYTALLVPFMYLMDRFAYRAYLRRVERAGSGSRKREKT